MSKTVTAGMTTHLSGPSTTLTLCWKVTRPDDQRVFGFTAHDQDIEFEGVTYLASSGFRRTAIANSASMAVDNLDVTGILNNSEITQQDIQNGRYDRAAVEIFALDYTDTTNGDIKLRSGQFGEVQTNSVGTFTTELRGMTQRLHHNFMRTFIPTCRNDLGDSNCTVPINPDLVVRNTAYSVGDFVRAASGQIGFPLTFPMDDDDGDEVLGRLPVAASGADQQFNKSKMKFGNGAIEFLPTAAIDPSDTFLEYTDDAGIEFGSGDFTIDLWVRFNDLLTDTTQTFLSKWTTAGNLRAWRFGIDAGVLTFEASPDGTGAGLLTLSDEYPTAFNINTWYHVSVDRSGNDWRMYVNGQTVDLVTSVFTIDDNAAPMRVGKIRELTGDDDPLYGLVDDLRITVGTAQHAGPFTPPTAAYDAPGFTQSDYDNRIYECTTAGTTAATQPSYDTVVDNTTADGTAVFTAREAWMRDATVNVVTDQRTFTITVTESRAVDDWFNGGVLEFEDGTNLGRRIEIKDWVNSTATITLWDDAYFTLSGGELIRLYPGCNRTRPDCRDKFVIPSSTNFADGNMRNFDGEPDVPGEDFFLQAGTQS